MKENNYSLVFTFLGIRTMHVSRNLTSHSGKKYAGLPFLTLSYFSQKFKAVTKCVYMLWGEKVK